MFHNIVVLMIGFYLVVNYEFAGLRAMVCFHADEINALC